MSKSLTVAQLVAHGLSVNPALTEDQVLAVVRAQKLRSLVKVSAAVSAMKKVRKARKSGTVVVHAKGPKGFDFGPVWKASVALGKGVAVSPVNRPKLVEFAQLNGVEFDPSLDEKQIASLISKAVVL